MEILPNRLISWRRDFHRYPEQGFLEMRTASIVAAELDRLGFELALGQDVMKKEACMGKPDDALTESHYDWAKENGANEAYLAYFKNGYTGIVATLDTKRPGPTLAFRFDMDALPITESDALNHAPKQLGFRSIVEGSMHACGHDAHTAIGLGLANMLAKEKDQLNGVMKIIFQPAEEGTRGAKAMVEAGVVDDVDYFIASHIGTGVPHRHFVAATNGFMATTKLNITFSGIASHAGGSPEEGKNALLAAANATLNMHAICRHSAGDSRVHVGELHAGSGRNVVASHAELIAETRGETSEVNQYMKEQVENIVAGAASMYGVDYHIKVVGEALNSICSDDLAETLANIAKEHPFMEKVVVHDDLSAGSEDATYFINEVQRQGGQATYCIFGTELAAGHHHECFDIDEASLLPAVEILHAFAKKCK
ncbi:amidohydrolase [Pseudogracilibacillus sp. SO30301A]|uniref:amidohydrolase n=1 Tax=Pseudogracilibacillus sp. SO30301A TaxID=3098291 RepID=UPI00300E2859